MSNVAQNGEKTFEYYLDLPNETRMEIVNAMQLDDRCRFTRCSKLSNKEAKASKNFIRGLIISSCRINVSIHVCFGGNHGYTLNLSIFPKREMTCKTNNGRVVWREDLDVSVDLVLLGAEKFKHLLQMYQSKIKLACLGGPDFNEKLKNYDFGIENFGKLEILTIEGGNNVAHYLSKTRRPLESFAVLNVKDDIEKFENFEQIYQVTENLFIDDIKLNYEKFTKLSASNVRIHIGGFTVEDISQIIKSWQNGTIGKRVEKFEWCKVHLAGFDYLELFRLFGLRDEDAQGENLQIEIKHHNNPRKSAKLSYDRKYSHILTFAVNHW